jgi:hypothetical protein
MIGGTRPAPDNVAGATPAARIAAAPASAFGNAAFLSPGG